MTSVGRAGAGGGKNMIKDRLFMQPRHRLPAPDFRNIPYGFHRRTQEVSSGKGQHRDGGGLPPLYAHAGTYFVQAGGKCQLHVQNKKWKGYNKNYQNIEIERMLII